MLYPDFDELVSIKARVANWKILPNYVTKSDIHGSYFSKLKGHGLEFAEVRQYVNGDDVRRIDWRVTARTSVPHIKLFTEERERKILVLVDTNASMAFGTRGTFKSVQAARCASYLGWLAYKDSNLFGAILFGGNNNIQVFRPTRSKQSLWQMLRTLAAQEIKNNQVELGEIIELAIRTASPSALVFVISDFMKIDHTFEEKLSNLAARCQVVLVAINDPIDKALPRAGDIIFADGQSEKININTNSNGGREIYRKQWQDRCDKLDNLISQLNVSMIEFSTDREIYSDLFLGLKRIEKYRRK